MRPGAAVTVIALLLGGCGGPVAEDAGVEATDEQIARAEAVADELMKTLGAHLFKELDESGPAGAIQVCSEIAPKIAEELSGGGVLVRRVTLRPRNPASRAYGWSSHQLRAWQRSHALGRTPEPYATVAVNTGEDLPGERELWYMKPLLIAPPCLNCHGDPATMDPSVVAQLSELYPDDEAVGYELNDLRGAVFVRLGLEGQKDLPILGPRDADVWQAEAAGGGDL